MELQRHNLLASELQSARQAFHNRTAFFLDNTQISYKDLGELSSTLELQIRQVLKVVHEKQSRSVRIGLLLPNGFPLSLSLLTVASHWTACPINPAIRFEEMKKYIQTVDIDLLVTNGENREAIDACISSGVPVAHLTRKLEILGTKKQEALTYVNQPDFVERPAILLATSGTTGSPKVVPLSQENVIAGAKSVINSLALTETDVCLSMWNQFHIGGFVDLLLAPLLSGGGIIATNGFRAGRLTEALINHSPTWVQFVPTTLREAAKELEKGDVSAQSLRFIRCVAAALDQPTRLIATSVFQKPIVETYGMTEASPLITTTPVEIDSENLQSGVGKPAPGVEIRIKDPDANGDGEICIKGPNVFSGYENVPTPWFEEDWFRTGDVGRLDDSGNLHLVGRLKEQINRGGEKINPAEVEEVVQLFPGVVDACGFGVPHKTLGEAFVMAVVLSEHVADLDNELQIFLKTRVSPHKIPSRILVLEEIPRNSTGKPLRSSLRELASGKLIPSRSSIESSRSQTDTEEILRKIWAEELEIEPASIGPNDDFVFLGGDSLSSLRIALVAEELFDIKFKDSDLVGFTSLRKMSSFIGRSKRKEASSSPSDYGKSNVMKAGDNRLDVSFYRERLSVLSGLGSKKIREQAFIHLTPSELHDVIYANPVQELLTIINPRASTDFLHWRSKLKKELRAYPESKGWSREACFDYGTLYTYESTAEQKELIICFTGSALRMMMPCHSFLLRAQQIQSDFLFLYDPNTTHYQEGIPGIGGDLLEVAQTLERFSKERGYGLVKVLGASAGGLAALAVGLSLQASSIGLIAPDKLDAHPVVQRLLIDFSRACGNASNIRAISSARPRDTLALEEISELFPNTRFEVDVTSSDHNILRTLWHAGRSEVKKSIEWLLGVAPRYSMPLEKFRLKGS